MGKVKDIIEQGYIDRLDGEMNMPSVEKLWHYVGAITDFLDEQDEYKKAQSIEPPSIKGEAN